MKLTEEADVVADHAFESESNLRIAAKVGLAFPTIKERIVREFIASLIDHLNGRLGESWVVEDGWSESPLERHCYVAAYKETWADDFGIGFGCEQNGPSELAFYVWCSRKQETPLIAELKQALDRRYADGRYGYADGRYGFEYPWWKFVDFPYRDWNTEEALIALWKKNEAIEYYAKHLHTICKIAGPFGDKICAK